MFLGVPIIAVLVYLMNHLFDYMLYKKHLKADLSNVTIPDINPENVFIPKDFSIHKEVPTSDTPSPDDLTNN